jgi:riboflavin transporter FmnP
MKTRTKNLTMTAVLCAIAFAAMYFGRIPVISFLKYDPKDIIITFGGFIYGPLTAFVISLVVSLLEMFLASTTGFIGLFMNVLASCSFACIASLIYKHKKTISGAAIGLVAGCIAMTVMMLLWNYFITPLYLKTSRAEVAGMLATVFLPFNLLKGGLNAALTFLLYKPLVKALRGAHIISESKTNQPVKSSAAFMVIAGVILVTCVILVLVLKGII